MVVPDAGELLFSIIFSYMGALEFFFIARNLYHWGFKHHKRMIELADDQGGLTELQDKIKAAINEANEKELYGLNAMKDGVLYKDGFRVSPGKEEAIASGRQVIGSSRNSLERKNDSARETSENDEIQKSILPESCVEKQNKHNLFVEEAQQQDEVIEEPCIKKHVDYRTSENYSENAQNTAADVERTNLTQTIKTQFGQTSNEQYSLKSKENETDGLNVGQANLDDSSSNEPSSTQTSDFSKQQSSSLDTTMSIPEMHFDEYERPEPDGQDVNELRYSEDYLRSLDGIKYRPLVRDDGTGRRRAFKKRRSSGDSTSSRESRASREEEVKMFTSLEEEEFAAIKRGDTEYAPICYSSDPNLKVNKHSRRHKRSPVKSSRESVESRSSLEMLDEEKGSPWGEVKPEHYKDMEFWKREKEGGLQSSATSEAIAKCKSPSPARNIPEMLSFEEATHSQHKNAISSLKKGLSQDEETVTEQKPIAKSPDKSKNVSIDDNHDDESTALLPPPADNPIASTSSNEHEKSIETDENVVHDQQADDLMKRLSSKLRRSPRQDDMEYYEEQFIEEERRASRTPSPKLSELENRKKNNEIELEKPTFDELNAVSKDLSFEASDKKTTISNEMPKIEIDYAPNVDNIAAQFYEDSESEEENAASGLMEGISDFYDFNASVNPSRSPSRSSSRCRSRSQSRASKSKSPGKVVCSEQARSKTPSIVLPENLMPGVSDWYDFNVMLNQRAYDMKIENERETYHTSTDFLISKLTTQSDTNKLKNQPHNRSPDNGSVRKKSKEKSLTFEAVSGSNKKNEEISDSSQNFKNLDLEQEKKSSTSLENSTIPHHKSYLTEGYSENSLQEMSTSTPNEVPETPQYPRSFSAEFKDNERLREEYQNEFKRSTYVGESTDFSDQFEELREKTRLFRRSRSKSRTPNDQDIENIQLSTLAKSRRRLQDKILAEITKTTLDYQDFAKDINRDFLDHERRGSDSALLQKSEILIQFQGNQSRDREYDDVGDLEAEEYHHFRRFSLNQEAQIEEYPDDAYIYEYIQQIDLKNGNWISKIENNQSNDIFTTEKIIDVSSTSNEVVGEQLNQVDAEDLEDSDSEDERQTVVDVEDEIDEDIWDYEKSDEFNEQSECEEAEREADRYVNRSAGDWKEEGAVGGLDNWHNTTSTHENVVNIEDMYDDALKYIEEGRIEKDYETLIEQMNNEDQIQVNRSHTSDYNNNNGNSISIKTEDLIEEILMENEEERNKFPSKTYRSQSSSQSFLDSENRYSSRSRSKSSTQSFIDQEKNDEVGYYVSSATVVHHNTASTRLRSRYGLPPSTTFSYYDYDDTINVDLNYVPKKEYNWRKNFKIDDDDEKNEKKVNENSSNTEEKLQTEENKNEELRQYLDTRKYSLGGESVTLYSRSLESEERQLEIDELENIDKVDTASYENIKNALNENQKLDDNQENSQLNVVSVLPSQDMENVEESSTIATTEAELQSDVLPKKKKGKKKSRKGSKASIGDDISSMNSENLVNGYDVQESSSKRKLKKKKKVKTDVDISSPNTSPHIKSPEPEPEQKHEIEKYNCHLNASELKSSETELQESRINNENKISQSISPVQSNPKDATPLSDIKSDSSSQPETLVNASTVQESTRFSKSPHLEEANASGLQTTITTITTTTSSAGASKNKPVLEHQDSSVYELIKDGSMYPWF